MSSTKTWYVFKKSFQHKPYYVDLTNHCVCLLYHSEKNDIRMQGISISNWSRNSSSFKLQKLNGRWFWSSFILAFWLWIQSCNIRISYIASGRDDSRGEICTISGRANYLLSKETLLVSTKCWKQCVGFASLLLLKSHFSCIMKW